MTSTQPVPAFVAGKRARKAERIANHLARAGHTADSAVRLADQERRDAEDAAGVPKASDTTWRSVIEMLAGSSMSGALCRTCGLGDPDGVPGPPQPYNHDGPCSQ